MKRKSELLAWHTTGTLERDDLAQIEEAIHEDPELAEAGEQLAQLRDLLQEDAVSPGDAAACLMKTKARIAREAPARNRPTRWWLAAGFCATALLAVGLFQGTADRDSSAAYETLTSAPDGAAGITARIIFAESVTPAEVEALTKRWQAVLVDGGARSNVVTLRFPEGTDLSALEADDRIRMIRVDAP